MIDPRTTNSSRPPRALRLEDGARRGWNRWATVAVLVALAIAPMRYPWSARVVFVGAALLEASLALSWAAIRKRAQLWAITARSMSGCEQHGSDDGEHGG